MDVDIFNCYMKASFLACLFSLVLARLELNPVSASPEEIPTEGVQGGDRKGYPGFAANLPWCPEGWYLYPQTNSCFRRPQKYQTLKHTAAQEFCRHEGGSLATVTGQELQNVLTKQAIDPSNSTLVWWMGYMLVPSVSGDVDKPAGSGGSNSNNTTTSSNMWQVQTEEQTGPEPLVDNSANIPTTVPEDLKGQPVVCIQLKLVYLEGFLKKWGWNLAQCDESVPFICKKTASKSCYDRKGHLVPEGDTFTPPGHDGCTQCTCLHGVPNICSIAGCAPPTCSRYENNPDECCQYTCLDADPTIPDSNDPSEPIMSENMRWVLTMITSFLLLGMMLFMVYRMRQKRIAYLRYRVQQLRDTQDGEFEPGSGPPPVPALDDLDGAIFREPPPPYSFFKDSNRIEMPPPYNVQQNASQRISRQEVNHNRDSRGSDQPDNVRLLPGSEPTTPSDISTISTLASPPPYNRCQSSDSMPVTPAAEMAPMLPILTATDQQQSATTSSTMPRSSPTRSPTRTLPPSSTHSSTRSPPRSSSRSSTQSPARSSTRSSSRSSSRSSTQSPIRSPTLGRNTTV
ncbi:integral membrane protein DGCR2/IDD-like [Lytechinus variegatus]|uniref:integral membrane protein DGCR2/IDD-like n=1 Tax=Lytechinus variegatus TaxID=7654 RepID=UPI001BB1F211|nr:integral membrane protein DGCR2/IDD-like [Lytechinus variegatus]